MLLMGSRACSCCGDLCATPPIHPERTRSSARHSCLRLLLWQWGGGDSIPEATLELREKRASVGIALAFVVLAITVGATAAEHVAEKTAPTSEAALLGVSAPSVVIFLALAAIKQWLGFATKSPSLKKDAACSLSGALLSLGVCMGTVVADEMYYFDALVALVISGGLLLHGIYTLVKNACVGNRWWARSFWMVAPTKKPGSTEVAPKQMLEATDEDSIKVRTERQNSGQI